MNVKFICTECRREFTVECDHAIPGIEGHIYTRKGELHRFVDPTESRLCNDCCMQKISALFESIEKNEKEKNV